MQLTYDFVCNRIGRILFGNNLSSSLIHFNDDCLFYINKFEQKNYGDQDIIQELSTYSVSFTPSFIYLFLLSFLLTNMAVNYIFLTFSIGFSSLYNY